MAMRDCRYFTGYKPCQFHSDCKSSCTNYSPIQTRVLIIHLGALGAVLRSTSLLLAIKRKYGPHTHITWLTQKPAEQLLAHIFQIDRVVTLTPENLLMLSGLRFDVCLSVDKSNLLGGLHKALNVQQHFGFQVEIDTGAIVPATPAAQELWQIGLSNHLKFNVNRKAETQLVTEALELNYQRDSYMIALSEEEQKLVSARRNEWRKSPDQILVGLNTGCSTAIPYKKLSVEGHRKLIQKMSEQLQNIQIVLLGGNEDHLRNQQIAYGLNVIQSPTRGGLRDGIASVAACDLVITGDSLGMHLAIALQKWTVAWFGPTCAHEIDLYDRGVAVLSQAPCGPCWKRSCHKETMCYDLVDHQKLIDGVQRGIEWFKSFSIPHLSGISFSQSPSCDTSRDFIDKTISF
jgi:heptosyltransferase-2